MTPLNRRQFLTRSTSLLAAASLPSPVFSQESMRKRPIPSSGEEIPVCGLGSASIFAEIPPEGREVPISVISTMVDMGGRVIDAPSFIRGDDPVLGALLEEMGLLDEIFLSAKITVRGKEAGVAHLERLERVLKKKPVELLMVHNMMDLATHWPTLKEWKEAGRAKYIGVTQTEREADDALVHLIENESPDIIQVNYSIQQPQAADRILPAAHANGVAVMTSRPFSNGRYFGLVSGHELPDWAADFDCESWAQFSLKYVLSHPAVTCALSETSKPHHVTDNMGAGYGRLPDEAMRQRMFDHLWSI